MTWNPESKRSPTHKRFREGPPDARVKVAEINWRDNPWFPAVLDRTRQRDMASRSDVYGHIWDGEFALVFSGAYYVKELLALKDEGRLCSLSVDPLLPVHVSWDLGIGDSTALWFFQVVGSDIRVVDFYENHGQGLPHYASVLAAKGYKYGTDWVPHDAKVRELGTGRTRVETLTALGRKPQVIPNHTLMDGINAVRQTLPKCWFDEKRTEYGLDALRQYRSEFKEDDAVFNDKPLHDWTSHAADSFRYLAMAWRLMTPAKEVEKPKQLVFEAKPDGSIHSNMSVREIIDAKKRQRNKQIYG